jgi:multidrug efflux pump subunit AcrA (membrane-fusion protein)
MSRSGCTDQGADIERACAKCHRVRPGDAHLPVKTSILNPPKELQLGMTATVTLPRFGNAPLTPIPPTALFQNNDGAAVWVVKPDNTLELRPVAVDRYEADRVLIREGLLSGDRIVTAGVHKLAAGQKVRLLGETAP